MSASSAQLHDVAVIGLGVMGAATVAALSETGVSAIGIDQYSPPHDLGSSHGETRLLRVAYAEGEFYVPMARRAIEGWRALEQSAGKSLFKQTGVVYAAPPESSLLEGVKHSANKHGIDIETLTSAELVSRQPELNIPADWEAVFEPGAGYLLAEEAVEAMLNVALRNNVKLNTNEKTVSVVQITDGFSISTDKGQYAAKKLIVCCGSWASDLLPELHEKLRIQRRVLHWFNSEGGVFSTDAGFKPFCIEVGDDWFYGFPETPAGDVKVAGHHTGYDVKSVHDLNRHAAPEEADAITALTQKYFPNLGKYERSKACVYTTSPDEHFILGEHPEKPGLFIATGFSGHGFKFAPAIGELLADMATGDAPSYAIDLFSPGRVLT